MFSNIALLAVRVVVGLLLFGHGAQKLFGWFGGGGLKGTSGWLGSMGLRPAWFWGLMAGLSEFGGGILFALGLLDPIGSLGISASMLTAIITVHWSKGVWGSNGGIEFPLTNLIVALGVALAGPGAYSLDAILGVSLPEPASVVGGYALVILATVGMLLTQKHNPAPTNQPKAA